MKFRLVADLEFEAVDIEDALMKLSAHFEAMAKDGDSDLVRSGSMSVAKEPERYTPAQVHRNDLNFERLSYGETARGEVTAPKRRKRQ